MQLPQPNAFKKTPVHLRTSRQTELGTSWTDLWFAEERWKNVHMKKSFFLIVLLSFCWRSLTQSWTNKLLNSPHDLTEEANLEWSKSIKSKVWVAEKTGLHREFFPQQYIKHTNQFLFSPREFHTISNKSLVLQGNQKKISFFFVRSSQVKCPSCTSYFLADFLPIDTDLHNIFVRNKWNVITIFARSIW